MHTESHDKVIAESHGQHELFRDFGSVFAEQSSFVANKNSLKMNKILLYQ